MAITRRQFIKRTGLAAAGGFFGPSLLRNPWLQKALADTIGDRYFVVVYLDGGNDGLNTVTPKDNVGGLRSAYTAERSAGVGGLQLPANSLLSAPSMIDPNSGALLGLHPGLQGLMNLYNTKNNVAIIQGCGYPRYNLSHEISNNIWETADPLGANGYGTGWMGRYLAANYVSNQIPALCVRDSIAGEFVTNQTGVLSVRRLQRFGFPYDDSYDSDLAFKRGGFLDLCNLAIGSPQSAFDFLGNGGKSTLLSSESYPGLHEDYAEDPVLARTAFNQMYSDLDTTFARDMREVAKVIYGIERSVPNVNARFFEVRNGGYDTHSDQGGAETDGQHYLLHKEVADAIEVFYADCEDMGVADKVCLMVWSEFSRRVGQNDNGTDHGSQGPMFVIGGKVNGGVYGNHPNIAAPDDDGNTDYSQNPGDGFRSTDLRDVYGTILKHWLNMPAAQISSLILPTDAPMAGEERWTVANFDLSRNGGATPLFDPTP